jgi:exopolysaccharide production protein ExoQ
VTYAAWQPPQHAAPAHRADMFDWLAFGLAVFMLVIHSQAWILPLVGETFDEGSSALVRNAYLPAYAAGILLLAMSLGESIKGVLRQPFLVMIMLVAAASMLWSLSPDATMRRLVALYATTLAGVVIAARYRWATLAEVMGAAFAILAIGSLLMVLAVPSIGKMQTLFPGAWRGLWVEKNALGGNMAMGFAILAGAAMLVPKRRWLWGGLAAVALLLVLMSTSKTALVSLALGCGALAFIWIVRRGPASATMATWAAVVGAFLAAAFMVFAADVFLGYLGKDATLTGRTKIWAAIWTQIQERPWTGYGYSAVWDDKSGWGPLAWITKHAGFKASHAHNAWLEQWLGMGYVGLAAWALFYMQTMGAAVVATFREKGAYLALPFLVIYSLTTLTESFAVSYNDFRWVIFVALAVKLALPDRDQV